MSVIHLDRARAARNRERRDRPAETSLDKLASEGLIDRAQWEAGMRLRHAFGVPVEGVTAELQAVVGPAIWARLCVLVVNNKLPTDMGPIRAGLQALADHWGRE